MKSNLEKLKEKIIETNPSILELKFGCRIKIKSGSFKGSIFTFTTRQGLGDVHLRGGEVWTSGDSCGACEFYKDEFEILGRQIRLADIYAAFFEEYKKSDDKSGLFATTLAIAKSWNLRDDDLDHQSEETLQFLTSILVIE